MTNGELNTVMAEKVMGWTMSEHPDLIPNTFWEESSDAWPKFRASRWRPATDANDTLRVLGKLGEKGISYTIYLNSVELFDAETGMGVGDVFYDGTNDLCHAICEAAAKAVEA